MKVRLGDIAIINMGQSPESSSYNKNGDGLPFFQGNADFGEIHPTARIYCNAPRKIANIDDILISVRAPIGALNIADSKCCIGRGLAALTVDNKICLQKYLWYVLTSKVKELQYKGTGSIFKAINRSTLENTNIPLPAMSEQIHISSVLDMVSEIILLRKKQLAKVDELVRAKFFEMFGDVIINNKHWDIKLWREVLTIINGRSHKAVEDSYGEYAICGSAGEMGRAREYLTRENSVIIGRKGNINKPILMRKKFWNIDTAFGLEPNEKYINAEYLYLYCLMFDFERINRTVTIPSLTKADLLKIEIPVPPIELQNKFASFVSKTDEMKSSMRESLSQMELLKSALMQKYFA